MDLRSTRQVRVTLRAVTGTGRRGLPISLTVFRDWGPAANLGTVTADGVLRTYTFNLPTSVRSFNNNFRFTVSNQGLTALSTLLSQRTARVSFYSIDLIV